MRLKIEPKKVELEAHYLRIGEVTLRGDKLFIPYTYLDESYSAIKHGEVEITDEEKAAFDQDDLTLEQANQLLTLRGITATEIL